MAPILTEEQYLKDCRGDSVPSRRLKDKKARYRNVNMALMGTERYTHDHQNAVWNDRNKYKMNRHSEDGLGKCNSCRTAGDRPKSKLSKCFCGGPHSRPKPPTFHSDPDVKKRVALAREMRSLNEFVVTKKGGRSRNYEIDLERSLYEDDAVCGVLYSYDAIPATRSNILGNLVAEAEIKYENEVVERLVRTEYEVVETSEEDSDEEFELI